MKLHRWPTVPRRPVLCDSTDEVISILECGEESIAKSDAVFALNNDLDRGKQVQQELQS